jgi:RNA polymerase sigma-70 factor (ECF subfamily)
MSTSSHTAKNLEKACLPQFVNADDAVLIALSKQGDRDAFNQLVDRYSTQIYNFALRMTNNAEDAQDIYQEAFIHAFRGIGRFRSDSAFSTWLYRIVRNVYLDEQKRRRSRPYVSLEETIETEDGSIAREVEDDAPSPEDIVQTNERRRAVQRAITQLPERQREILVLYDIQGCTYEEIARILEINVGTVKSRLNRARRGLRDRLLPFKELFDL